MKIQSGIFTLFFSLLLFAGLPLIACGPSIYSNEGRLLLFRNGLDGLRSLEPFYYSENFLNSYAPDPAGRDYQRNCSEWRTFTGNKAGVSDIYAIQYETGARDFLDACAKGNWKFFGNNSFMLWLQRKENKAALDYMILAKRAELTQFGNTDPWADDPATSPDVLADLAQKATNLCAKEKNNFLRERYAFQALKMAYYAGPAMNSRKAVLALYPAYLEKSQSVVLGWAQLFYALQSDDPMQQAIYILQSFDNSEEKKVFCYQQLSRATLDSLLPQVKDKKIKELVHVMRAMKSYGRAFEHIKAVYDLNPQSKYLPLLITREVNKLEDWIWSPELLGFNGISFENGIVKREPYNKAYAKQDSGYVYFARKNLEKDKQYLSELRSFLEKAAAAKGSNKDFLQLCTAHLYNITGDYKLARDWVNQMEPMQDKHYETQRIIEATISFAYTEDITTRLAKDRLTGYLLQLTELNPAFGKNPKIGDDDYYMDAYGSDGEENDDLDELMLLLSNRYKSQGDLLTAGLLYTKANLLRNVYDGWADTSDVNYRFIAFFDREATPATIDSLLAFKHKERTTVFEDLIKPRRWAKEDFYKDLKGTILVRRQQYREALAVFTSMDSLFWQQNYEYKSYLPINSVTHLGTLAPWDTTTATPYPINSKKLIMEEVVALQDSINMPLSREVKARLHYRLGNALYSFSYYGKAWMMMSYGQTSREEWHTAGDFAYYSFYPNSLRYGDNYYGCSNAIAAFTKALELSRDKEMKAKCLLSLALCDDNAHAMRESREGRYNPAPYRSPYLDRLLAKFDHTVAYEVASTTCPDISPASH